MHVAPIPGLSDDLNDVRLRTAAIVDGEIIPSEPRLRERGEERHQLERKRTGSRHQAAQDRLGAGRIFHCMSSVGQMWRAFDLMTRRAITRHVHGGMLETKQFTQGFLVDSYIDIQAARLMTIHTAQKLDAGLDARTDISAIKVFVPAALERVVDRAIQVHGALGVTSDTPLEGMYRGARTLRIADGPDEVHRIVIAKNVLKRYHEGLSWDFGI
jgi:acyl-CoA dehydrogenase